MSDQTTVQALKGIITKELGLTTENMELHYQGSLLTQDDHVMMKYCDKHNDAHHVVFLNYR